jgi:hypothetical protein
MKFKKVFLADCKSTLAKKVALALEHELYDDGGTCHEMWNGWIGCDPYEFAQNLDKYHLIILGYFKLKSLKPGTLLDIGIVAEDEDGERFWCHYSSKWIKDWKDEYPELYKED